MIAKDDWRLTSGPVLAYEERLKAFHYITPPFNHFPKNGSTNIVLFVEQNSPCVRMIYSKAIAQLKKISVRLSGFARSVAGTSRKCSVGH